MKDELLKILNIKLKYLDDNIDALNRMNDNLEKENEGLEYIRSILNLFENSDGEYSVYNFSKIEQDNFEKIMIELSHDVQAKFETENCNYEGLIYLINGINNGISLKLTDEQITAIESMIDEVVNRQTDYLARIDGILLAKSHLDISDLEQLTSIKEKYDCIVEKLEKGDYVDETDEVIDAINYSRIADEKSIEILSYLLRYNSEIYHQKKEQTPSNIKNEKELPVDISENDEIDLSKPFITSDTELNEISNFEQQNKFEDIKFDKIENQYLEEMKNSERDINDDVQVEDFELRELVENDDFANMQLPEVDLEDDESMVDEDFKDLVNEDDYSEEYNPLEINQIYNTSDETLENLENNSNGVDVHEQEIKNNDEDQIKKIFDEYKIKYNELNEEDKKLLLSGNVESYQNILMSLKEKNVLETFQKNPKLLVQVLINSEANIIENVLEVIGNELSVDKEDMQITTNIMICALPSVFVKEPSGNYETFMANIKSFKEWGIDLINLFDFSREVYVMNHEQMLHNYQIVKSYNLEINDKNAKYLLVLPNIAEKIDYYVEAVAVDTMKNGTGKTFDGSEYIKLYPSKLNSVTETTIKRLRYSSENGKKLFGAKENSLAGEITNLKVDVLNIDDEYLRTYFNNEFDQISHDEVLDYERLIQQTNDYSLNLDETLENLNQYLNGMRYNIEGVNISRNKLVRNYNILVKNGVDKNYALVFAACYNAVITKDEYQKVKNTLSNIGGK